ncbi:MAG: metallophosphoesterase [Eubacteriales bacterium]|nr:metallophosphoesterase [Eubacteriales bacterium]
MLAVYLSPLYAAWNILQLIWILRWMQNCSGFFRSNGARTVVVLIYAFFAVSMLIAFFLPPSQLQRWMKVIGNYWLGTLLYMTLTIGAALVIRFLMLILPLKNKGFLFSRRGFAVSGAVCLLIIVGLSIWGIINARTIRITRYTASVNKECSLSQATGGTLRIALIADLHLGYNISNGSMRKMVEKLNEEAPDLVVIAGDIFDNEYEALEDPEELAQILSGIRSKYGVFACYGNHDIQEPILAGFTFGSKTKKMSDPRMDELLEKAGIRLLRDEAVLIEDAFYVYGRPDYERPGRGIDQRKTPEEITAGLDQTKPIIVIDHQPRELKELADAGVDIDLCGHTHDGQMFPANLLVSMMWENSCGMLKKGNMTNIVTSGLGVFGPFMRVGTKSEICMIDVNFR